MCLEEFLGSILGFCLGILFVQRLGLYLVLVWVWILLSFMQILFLVKGYLWFREEGVNFFCENVSVLNGDILYFVFFLFFGFRRRNVKYDGFRNDY